MGQVELVAPQRSHCFLPVQRTGFYLRTGIFSECDDIYPLRPGTGRKSTLAAKPSAAPILAWVDGGFDEIIDECGIFRHQRDESKPEAKPVAGNVASLLFHAGTQRGPHRFDRSHHQTYRIRTLHYFACNLSNGSINTGNALLQFVKSSRPDVAFLKSASYLLHEGNFSVIRDILLTQCRAIVQDDSGIPLGSFAPERWQLRNFGVYTPPLDIFKKYYQPNMSALYADHPAAPLPFGAGYHWDPKTANLMVFTATRRE